MLLASVSRVPERRKSVGCKCYGSTEFIMGNNIYMYKVAVNLAMSLQLGKEGTIHL